MSSWNMSRFLSVLMKPCDRPIKAKWNLSLFDMDMKSGLHPACSVYAKRNERSRARVRAHGRVNVKENASSVFCSWRQSSGLTPDHHHSPSTYLLCHRGPPKYQLSGFITHRFTHWLGYTNTGFVVRFKIWTVGNGESRAVFEASYVRLVCLKCLTF